MDQIKSLTLLVAVAVAMPLAASAASSVIVQGTRYTCTNTCVVTVTGDSYTVSDCCGGRVKFQIQ